MDYCPMQWKYAEGEEQDSHVKFFRGVEESARLSGTTQEQILKQVALAHAPVIAITGCEFHGFSDAPQLYYGEPVKKIYDWKQLRETADSNLRKRDDMAKKKKKKVRDDPWDKPMYGRNHE